MGDDLKPEKPEQKPKISLDPSKFKISEDGQVVITDPAFAEALRTASNDEGETPGHGISVGVTVSL